MRNQIASVLSILTLMCAAAPAYARVPPGGGGGGGGDGGTPTSVGCAVGDITPAAIDCVGWYAGDQNALTATAGQALGLNDLLSVSTYTSANVTSLEDIANLYGSGPGPNTIDFATPLFGTTIFSAYVLAGTGPNSISYSGTAFFVFDAGNLVGGLDSFGFNPARLESVRLYSTGQYVQPSAPTPAPEPASWALMLLGFGAIGAALRSAGAMRGAVLNGLHNSLRSGGRA